MKKNKKLAITPGESAYLTSMKDYLSYTSQEVPGDSIIRHREVTVDCHKSNYILLTYTGCLASTGEEVCYYGRYVPVSEHYADTKLDVLKAIQDLEEKYSITDTIWENTHTHSGKEIKK